MIYKINIQFTDGTFVFLRAYSFGNAMNLLNHVLTTEVKSFSVTVDNDD